MKRQSNIWTWIGMFLLALSFVLTPVMAEAKALPKNSVGTKQLRNKAVTTPKIRNKAVTTPKIRNGAVTASKLGAGAKPAGVAFKSSGAVKLTTAFQVVNSVTLTAPSAGFALVSHTAQAACGGVGNLRHYVKNMANGATSSRVGNWDMTTSAVLWIFTGETVVLPVTAGANIINVYAACSALGAINQFSLDDLSAVFIPAAY